MAPSHDTKPAYVFAGGVCHTPEFFEQVIRELNDRGYEATCVAYPTCSDELEDTGVADEIGAVKAAVCHYIDDGRRSRDVVLVTHSYGGVPGSRAVKGLDKDTRTSEGKAAGIVELVFLSAFLIPNNVVRKPTNPSWVDIEDNRRLPNEKAIPLLFSDLDSEAQQFWLSKFARHRIEPDPKVLDNAPWDLAIPKTYIILTEDKTSSPEFQLQSLQKFLDKTWAIKSLNSGHEPFLSQPKNLAKVLLQEPVRS